MKECRLISVLYSVFTARRYASAEIAVVMCVRLSQVGVLLEHHPNNDCSPLSYAASLGCHN